jgi:hypothetical protein
MAILYETFGDFNAGAFSYRLLLSKKTLGTITLTEINLSFESHVDKVVFNIQLTDIQDFFLRKRLSIPLIELITTHGTMYSLFPLIKKTTVFGSSLVMTEDLFRHLSKAIYIKDQVIFFDAVCVFYLGAPKSLNPKDLGLGGHIFITENNILFRSFQQGKNTLISVPDITQIKMEVEGSKTYTTLEDQKGNFYTILVLEAQRKKFREDKFKTEKLYDVLNQAKSYKESEKVSLDGVINGKITCSSCGNLIKNTIRHCPFCGNEN